MADTKNTLRCPACNKEMHKIFLPDTGFCIDICLDGCGGIYFDNREIKDVDEQHENIDPILEAVKGKEFTPVDGSKPRYCPKCGVKMVKNYVSANRQVQIDACYTCGGQFFDHGELTAMRNEYETEAERSEAMHEFVRETFGAQLKDIERTYVTKSPLTRFFEKYIWG